MARNEKDLYRLKEADDFVKAKRTEKKEEKKKDKKNMLGLND